MQKETIKLGKKQITYTVDRRGLFLITPAIILLFFDLYFRANNNGIIAAISVVLMALGFFIINRGMGVIFAIAAFLYYTLLYALTFWL